MNKQDRQALIDTGKIWQVYCECQGVTSKVLFEGIKTKAMQYIRDHFGGRAFRRGEVRLAKVIWEA